MKNKHSFRMVLFAAIFLLLVLAIGYIAVTLNPHSIFPLLAVTVNIWVGVFVYTRNRQNNLYKTFCLWSLVLGTNNLALLGLYVAPNASFAKMWTQVTGPGYYLIPATSLHFVLVFTKSKSEIKRKILYLCYGIAGVFIALSLIPTFENQYIWTGHKYSPRGTPLYTVSLLTLGVTVSGAVLQIIYSYFRLTNPLDRTQYRFLLFAGMVAFLLGGSGSLLSYGAEIYPLSSIAFTAYALILAYAIVRHRFLDIEVIIRKSLIYATLTLCVAGGYAGVMVVSNALFNITSPTASIPLNAAVIVAIAFLFQPLRTRIQVLVDKKFFREKYDYRETLRRFSDEIVRTIGIEELSLRLVNAVTDTMKIGKTSLILYNPETDSFETIAQKEFGKEGVFYAPGERRIEIDTSLLEHLTSEEQAIGRQELEFFLEGSEDVAGKEKFPKILKSLKEMEAEAAIPILLKDRLKGIFLVREKLSEERYSREDIELLQIIVNQIATAIENSELYDTTLSMKRYYDDILKSMTSGVLTVDSTGRIVTLNQAGEKILGYKITDIAKKDVREVFEANREFMKIIVHTLHSADIGGIAYNEAEVTYRSEAERRFAVTTSLLRNEKNKILGAVFLFTDITEKKELEKQLERSKRLAYMGEIAANIAHEIKNPIGSIRLFVDALSRDFSNPTAQKNFVEVIPQEIANIDKMIRDLLFLARPASLVKVDIDLAEIVNLVITLCSEDAAVKEVDLKAELPQTAVHIPVDSEKIKQAVRNIVLNAIEAVPPKNGKVKIRLRERDSEILISVSDNGPGMPDDVSSHLFQPFFTTKQSGTGLGLAIANKIVEDHGGTIKVNSKVGMGTIFTIVLPKQASKS